MARARLLLAGCAALLAGAGCGDRTAAPSAQAAEQPPQQAAAAEAPTQRLSGDYLGQTLPGPKPELFAGGIVSTGLTERDVALTPDGNELYFSAQLGRDPSFSTILVARRVGGEWVWPEIAPFSGQFYDIEPAVAHDGKRLYFVSNRPKPGATSLVSDEDIWVVDREGDAWGAPRNIGPPVNTDRPEFFPSLTRSGTLYFTAVDSQGEEAIFRARPSGDGFDRPERLPAEVNSGKARFNAFISPDESFLILCIHGLEDSVGGVDYYVVFRTPEDRWSQPINLGDKINRPTGAEWSASLSPDGKLLFFMSSRSVFNDRRAPRPMSYAELRKLNDVAMNGNADIWWIDASVIQALRPGGS